MSGLQIRKLNRSNLFLRQIANPSERLAESNTDVVRGISSEIEKPDKSSISSPVGLYVIYAALPYS